MKDPLHLEPISRIQTCLLELPIFVTEKENRYPNRSRRSAHSRPERELHGIEREGLLDQNRFGNPIESMGLVYLQTWMFDFYGKCR